MWTERNNPPAYDAMIKMIATDLDDTLLRTDKTVSSYTFGVIERVRALGIKVIFATGRGDSTESLLSHALFDGHVHLNGAKAYVGGRLVYDRTIPSFLFAPFLRELAAYGLDVVAEIDGTHFSNFDVGARWSGFDRFVISDFDESLGQAGKLYALIDHPRQLDFIQSRIPDDCYLTVTRDRMAMVMHKKARKSFGVSAVAEAFDIDREHIVAFGDDDNDVDMLIHVGHGVAMANAIDRVRDVADAICDTNDRDGVAKWLEEHVLAQQ